MLVHSLGLAAYLVVLDEGDPVTMCVEVLGEVEGRAAAPELNLLQRVSDRDLPLGPQVQLLQPGTQPVTTRHDMRRPAAWTRHLEGLDVVVDDVTGAEDVTKGELLERDGLVDSQQTVQVQPVILHMYIPQPLYILTKRNITTLTNNRC